MTSYAILIKKKKLQLLSDYTPILKEIIIQIFNAYFDLSLQSQIKMKFTNESLKKVIIWFENKYRCIDICFQIKI